MEHYYSGRWVGGLAALEEWAGRSGLEVGTDVLRLVVEGGVFRRWPGPG